MNPENLEVYFFFFFLLDPPILMSIDLTADLQIPPYLV